VLRACEQCRILCTSGDLAASIGGDSFADAHFAPAKPPNGEPGGASAQFVTGGGKWPQPGGLGTPVTITYSYQNMFDGALKMSSGEPLPSELIRSSIEQAFGLWAGVAPLHFVEVPDNGRSYGDPFATFGQIRFRHVFINGPDIPGQPPTTKAQAYFPSGGGHQAGDVEFDHGDPWHAVGTLSTPDVLGAAVHEIGHSLGLLHTNLSFDYVQNNQAVMFWVFRRFGGPGTGELHADDIAGIRAVYGSGVGSVLPLAVPEPATWMLLTIAMTTAWLGSDVGRAPRHSPTQARLPMRPV
jgi:hypothetical protein